MQHTLTTSLKMAALTMLQAVIIYGVYSGMPGVFSQMSDQITLQPIGLVIELTVFFVLFLMLAVVTGTLLYAYTIANLAYWLLQFSSAFKLDFLKAPIVYFDFYHVDDLIKNIDVVSWPILLALLMTVLLFLILLVLALKSSKEPQVRGLASGYLLLILVVIAVFQSHIREGFIEHKIKYKWNSNIAVKSQKFGFSAMFIQSVYFSSKLTEPSHYSASRVKQQVAALKQDKTAPSNFTVQPENVIILLVESFQDTEKLPWQSAVEPTPTYQQMKLENALMGEAIAPVFGGKSVNSEFELLTGFSSTYVPTGSIPYKDFINHEVPSIARQFKANGFIANVIQVVAMHGYGYESIYQHLGFDHQFSLSRHNPDINLDPTGRFGSSQAIAAQTIQLLESQDKSFIFAFPNSSHAPWKIDDYPGSEFRLKGLAQNAATDELVAYFSALNHVDQLFSLLRTWALASDETTIIMIVGDHQPALQANGKARQTNEQSAYQVPYLIWSNQALQQTGPAPKLLSMNLLVSFMFDGVGIQPTGWFAFLREFRASIELDSPEIDRTEEQHATDPSMDSELLKQFQALQYHFLSGQ